MNEDTNPWQVEDLDMFLFYCCPECEFKSQAKEVFSKHAYQNHTKSRDVVKPICKKESNFKEALEELPLEVSVKEELEDVQEPMDEEDPLFEANDEQSIDFEAKQDADHEEKDEDAPFQCYKCGDIFGSIKDVKKHLTQIHFLCRKSHYGKPREHQCFVCKCMYQSEETLNMHVCRSTSSTKITVRGESKCHTCDIIFKNTDKLVTHNRTFHHELNFSCDQCDFKTKLAKSLTNHKKRMHEKVKDEVCHVCGRKFFSKYEMLEHMDVAHNNCEKKYICDKCGDSFAKSHYLKSHQRENHPVYLLCAICDSQFSSSKNLRVHLTNEHQIKCGLASFYVCDMCKDTFDSIKQLDDHLIMAHEKPAKEECCDFCEDMSFAGKVSLKMHVLESHAIELTKSCNAPFISELFQTFKSTNNRLFQYGCGDVPCPVCQKMFTSKRGMVDHRRQMHEKDKHMKCELCDYSTFQPNLMNKHVSTKHSSTKYQCDQCSYSTCNDRAFKSHKMRVHDKVYKFTCPHCAKGYFVKSKFTKHLFNVHNVIFQS